MLDSYHVLQHLQDLRGYTVDTDIKSWIKDIAKTNGIDVDEESVTIVTAVNLAPIIS